jgi:hypothetical protein
MSKTQALNADILQWPPEVSAEATHLLLAALKELPVGEIQELSSRIVEQLFPTFDDAVKEDVIANLRPFELLECAWSESAEDGSPAFMGPNWCAFSVYKLAAEAFLVVEDRIEEREYEVVGSASSFNDALRIVRNVAFDRLGGNIEITFSDGTTIGPSV